MLMDIIQRAATDRRVLAVEKLSQLLDVKDRWEKEEARKAFVAAMAEFKRNPARSVENSDRGFRYW